MVESFQKRDRDRRNALKRRDKEAKRREKSRAKRGDLPSSATNARDTTPAAPALHRAFDAPRAPAPASAPALAPAPAPAPASAPASPADATPAPRILAPWLRTASAPQLAPPASESGDPRS